MKDAAPLLRSAFSWSRAPVGCCRAVTCVRTTGTASGPNSSAPKAPPQYRMASMPSEKFDALSTAIAWAIRSLLEQGLTPQQLGDWLLGPLPHRSCG